jgi:hypothetical protein
MLPDYFPKEVRPFIACPNAVQVVFVAGDPERHVGQAFLVTDED